jgi:hypothetical protein
MHPAPRYATFEDTEETEETSLWRRGKSADEAKNVAISEGNDP